MKAKKKSAHAKPTAVAEPGRARVLPTFAGLPIDSDGLDDLMQKLTIAAKQETDPAKFTRSIIALFTGAPNRK